MLGAKDQPSNARAERKERARLERRLDEEAAFRVAVVEAAKHARFNVGTEPKALRDLIAVIDRAEARCVAGAVSETAELEVAA